RLVGRPPWRRPRAAHAGQRRQVAGADRGGHGAGVGGVALPRDRAAREHPILPPAALAVARGDPAPPAAAPPHGSGPRPLRPRRPPRSARGARAMLPDLARELRAALGIQHKREIQAAARHLPRVRGGPWGAADVQLGDDAAAIPDGDGYLLLAAEGMWPELVA